jgi:hypothetical protein
MLRVEVSTLIQASPDRVMAIYCNYENWFRLFPTIRAVRILAATADTITLAIDHREGQVINLMTLISRHEVRLEEFKRFYDASFVNQFEAIGAGTKYSLGADIRLKGAARFLGPLLKGYIRRQMRKFVLEPVRKYAESAQPYA